MKRLIDDMLLLANSDADTLTIKPEACQPDLLLLDTYEKFEPLAKKNGLHLILTLPEEILKHLGNGRLFCILLVSA